MQPVRRLVPNFIIEKYKTNQLRGSFQGAAMFVDVSGFSKMTDALSAHGQNGAEALADLMRVIFEPLVNTVYEHGGFVIGYAGDAFNAVFPEDKMSGQETRNCLAALVAMQEHMRSHPQVQTSFGAFSIAIKTGMGYGETRWQMFKSETGAHLSYWLRGDSLNRAVFAEEHSAPGEIISDPQAFARIKDMVEAETINGEVFRITRVTADLPAPLDITEPEPEISPMNIFFSEEISRQHIVGEFRHVINVFIDIPVNISDEMLVTPFMETVYALQEKYGGYFLRPDLGDKGFNLLMFWGAPVARERDVERALNFVIDLAARTKLSLRAGITYRIAYAGFMGAPMREDYTAYGWGVNLAARLMTYATAGEFWLDEEIARRAEQAFDVQYLDDYAFKGFAQKQRTYRLLGRKNEARAVYHGELVGRESELSALADFINPMRSGKFAGVALILGEAGIGKSRFAHTFQTSAYFKDFSARWIPCQTEELIRESFNPFKRWLKKRLGVVEGEADAVNWGIIARALDALADVTPEPELAAELRRTMSVLAALVNVTQPDSFYETLDAKSRYENTLIALNVLFHAESLQQPIILFVEDVHWLDEDSAAFLAYFVRALQAETEKSYPVAIITTRRPEGNAGAFDEIPARKITLEKLSSANMNALAEALLGKPITDELRGLLDARAEGNPFFAEQILRYLSEENLLTLGADGKYSASRQAVSLLPVDVRAVMIARLDRLTRQVRETVQTAAVLGREFVVDVLVEMLHPQREELPAYVFAAEQADIWNSIGEINYIFRHALLRDAAYSMQLAVRQRELHALACAAMEEVYRGDLEPYYSELAYHAEKGGLREKAFHYLIHAGDLALSAYQNRPAIDYFTRALSVAPENDSRAQFDLLVKRVECFYNFGDSAAQLKDLEQMESLARSLNDNGLLARAFMRQAYRLSTMREFQACVKYAFDAMPLAESVNDEQTLLLLYIILPDALRHTSRLADARHYGQAALDLARKLKDRHREAHALIALGLVVLELEGPAVAQQYQENGLAVAREVKNGNLEGKALNNLANLVGLSQGDYHAARDYFQQALAVFQEQGHQAGKGLALANLGWVSGMLGDYAAALNYYERALSLSRELGHGLEEMYTYVNMSASAVGQEDAPEALKWAQNALDLAVKNHDRVAQGWSHFYLGHAQLLAARYEQAAQAFAQCVEIRVESATSALIVEARAGLAQAYAAAGNQSAALTEIEQALQHMEKEPSFEGAEEPLRVYLALYSILQAAKDPRAQSVLLNAKELLNAQVSKLRSDEARRMFIENVPWRRALRDA